jgi:hypothetical protein
MLLFLLLSEHYTGFSCHRQAFPPKSPRTASGIAQESQMTLCIFLFNKKSNTFSSIYQHAQAYLLAELYNTLAAIFVI